MPTFSSFDQENKKNTAQTQTYTSYDLADKQSKGLFLSKVYGMMFLCLLITTVVAAGLGYGLMYFFVNATAEVAANIMTGMIIGIIVSAVALLVMSFVLPITFIRGKHNIIVPLMIYVVLMGVLLSMFTWAFEPIILVESFGITALVFGIMALLGHLSKGKVAGIGIIMLGLILGAGILSLVNFVMIMIGGIKPENVMISWIVSLAVFAFLMFMTMWDVARINQIANKGMNSGNNLVYYCAYILYSDFIALLVRVIYYVALFSRRR